MGFCVLLVCLRRIEIDRSPAEQGLYIASMKRIATLLFISLFACVEIYAQAGLLPFQKEIDAFKKRDSLQMPAKNSILLIGSSSFTKWTDVQNYFPEYPILNRGFGGSSLPDVIHYVNDIVFPYDPKQIIVYCGENDIAASDTVTAKMVLQRFEKLFFLIRSKLKKVPVAFISIKPSPSRWKFEPVILEANSLITKFLRKQPKTSFINVHDAMLNADGSVKAEIFIGDKLHMNAQGYAIWTKVMKPQMVN